MSLFSLSGLVLEGTLTHLPLLVRSLTIAVQSVHFLQLLD